MEAFLFITCQWSNIYVQMLNNFSLEPRTWTSLVPKSLHIFHYFSKDSSSVRYLCYTVSQLLRRLNLNTIPGIYSAIFVLYLRYQSASKRGLEKTAMGNILFYSLCVLYVLTASVIMLDMSYFILRVVSNNSAHDHLLKDFGLTSCTDPPSISDSEHNVIPQFY